MFIATNERRFRPVPPTVQPDNSTSVDDAHRHALTRFAAGPNAGIQRHVVTDHHHFVSASGPFAKSTSRL